jgi:molybdopterin converting factor subunit 1
MAIRVRVLYFGQAREAVGRREEVVSLPNSSSVGALIDLSMRAHRRLQGLSGVVRVALNEEIAGRDDRLADGDVVAFLPPVAGG